QTTLTCELQDAQVDAVVADQVTEAQDHIAVVQAVEGVGQSLDVVVHVRDNPNPHLSPHIVPVGLDALFNRGVLYPTTVVGSYPQPDWLIDHDKLRERGVPRVRMAEVWRVADPYLAEAQDDATLLAIRVFEQLGLDVITDGEMRRESYSNRFATALDG